MTTQGFSSGSFFALFKGVVLAGAFAGPHYNGNNNMDGWGMKDYPGAQMTYIDVVSAGKFEKMDPVSLSGMQ